MARRMDPGLGTSERAAAYRSQSVMIPPQRQLDEEFAGAVAAITCRSCRARIPVDEIDAHECSPAKINPGNPSPTNRKVVEATASLLEASPSAGVVQTREAEVPLADTLPPPSMWTPATSLLFDSAPSTETDTAPTVVSVDPANFRQPYLSNISRSLSMPVTPDNVAPYGHDTSSTLATASASNLLAAFSPRARTKSSPNGVSSSLIQCRVRGVRVNRDRVAVYSIISSLPKKEPAPVALSSVLKAFSGPGSDASALAGPTVPLRGAQSPTASSVASSIRSSTTSNEIVVERRYREFYAFALNVYSMFPSRELWQRLPPKTYCAVLTPHRRLNDGFLIRRKNGLDDFVRCAIEMMNLGSSAHGSLAQWYLVRLFLNISPTALPCPTKDRSLSTAMVELKQHMNESKGWGSVGRVEEHDATFEKVADGFPVIKRVRLCRFPARAVFDMIVQRSDGGNSPTRTGNRSNSGGFEDDSDAAALAATDVLKTEEKAWDPNVESREVLRREDGNTWVERTIYKGRWMSGSLQTVSLKAWKVEESGAIVIASIPADERDWDDLRRPSGVDASTFNGAHRVDCILGGWLITPTPGEETCTVTWLVQANFGGCTPHDEFTGSHGVRSIIARRVLLSWADEISSLLASLEYTYEPEYYRRIGPLLSTSAFQKLQLDRPEATVSALEDPRVYTVARELEPCLCLLMHKSSNRNALVFKSKSDVDAQTPLKAEWIMFEKSGNPRQELSTVERNTTYKFSSRLMAPNVHRLSLELLRRDCVLRYDPMHGYALFTTINGRPNTLLKRVFLSYAKAPRIGFARLEEATLVGETETEVVPMN